MTNNQTFDIVEIEGKYQELFSKITKLFEQQQIQEIQINELLSEIEILENDINGIITKQQQYNEQLNKIQQLQKSIENEMNQLDIYLTDEETSIYHEKEKLLNDLKEISNNQYNQSFVPVHLEHKYYFKLLDIMKKQKDELIKLLNECDNN